MILWCRLPRWAAVTVSLLVAIGVVALIFTFVAISVRQLLVNSEKYETRARELIDSVLNWASARGVPLKETFLDKLAAAPISEIILRTMSSILQLFSDTLLMFLFIIYLLLEDPDVQVGSLREKMDRQIHHYILVKMLISSVAGLLTYLVLVVLKVDLSLVIGLLACLLNFIPNVGPLIAIVLPLPIVILDPDQTWSSIILALVVPGTMHFVIGNFLEPKILGQAMELHPVVVLVALVFWGAVWGIVGAILSVPVTAVLRIWLMSMEHPMPQSLGTILSGKFGVEKNEKNELIPKVE